jgi:hypothetical protein
LGICALDQFDLPRPFPFLDLLFAAGGAGAGISIATVLSVDPAAWTPWLQVATLSVGLITGLRSLVLVAMKLIQQRRDMRSG